VILKAVEKFIQRVLTSSMNSIFTII
jgi:hypothetical protein